jgi:predicted O-methyltransferase YrrM
MSNEYVSHRYSERPPNPEDWDLIHSLLSKRNKFLEIGVAEGRSVIKTADVLMIDGSEIVCVDPWLDVYDGNTDEVVFDKNLNALQINYPSYKFTKIKDTSTNVLAEYMLKKQQFDFIYIDSRKTGFALIEDFSMAFQVLNVGGILMVDDYYKDRKNQNPIRDSNMAMNMLLFQYQRYIQLVHKGKRCIIKKIKSTY